MRTVHFSRLTCALLCLGGLACVGPTDAAFDRSGDFSPFHTWDWQAADAPRVHAPEASPALLDSRLGRMIVGELSERGYVRGRERPDFRVAYQLSIEHRTELVEVPRAPYLLLSHHASPSYWIGGTDTERRRVAHLRLAVDIYDRSGKVVWKAAIRKRAEEGKRWDLEAAVDEVLARFPKARPLRLLPPDTADQLALLRN